MLCLYISVASFVLAFLNLLTIKGLDGGKALEEILTCYADADTVYTVMRFLSIFCVVLLGVLSVCVLMVNEFNFSLLLFTLYLSLSLFRL
jgi:membrane-associated protease RseP (regulator of RpoE activity)